MIDDGNVNSAGVMFLIMAAGACIFGVCNLVVFLKLKK